MQFISKLFGFVTWFFAIILCLIGFFGFTTSQISSNWIKVNGVVTGSTSQNDNETQTNGQYSTQHTVTYYYPEITYTVDGKQYQIVGTDGHTNPPQQGSTILVAYNPDNPTQAKQVPTKTGDAVYIAMATIGSLIIIYKIAAHVRVRRGRSLADVAYDAAAVPTPSPITASVASTNPQILSPTPATPFVVNQQPPPSLVPTPAPPVVASNETSSLPPHPPMQAS